MRTGEYKEEEKSRGKERRKEDKEKRIEER